MKKLLPILFITLTLAIANADITSGPQKKIINEQTLSKALQTESSAISELTLAQNKISKVTDSKIWKNQDIKKSKTRLY